MAQTTDDVMMENGRQLWHLLKTRWGNKANIKPQLVGIDFNKMRFYDLEYEGHHITQQVQSKVGQNKPEPKKREKSAIDFS